MNATKRCEILDEFENYPQDAYLILQIRAGIDRDVALFASMNELRKMYKLPEQLNYEPVYTGQLPSHVATHENCIHVLNALYESFNIRLPEDYHGRSLSVSDVLALKLAGETKYYFVDSVGFQELPYFRNYLQNAEMMLEDDYSMLDGIVNNGAKENEKASVLNQLKDIPVAVTGRIPRKHNRDQEIGG